MSIGQVAKRTGITVETVRFCEKQRLILVPQRFDTGYRQYPEETVKRVRFIQHAKEVGFTLKDIAELLALRQGQVRPALILDCEPQRRSKKWIKRSRISSASAMPLRA